MRQPVRLVPVPNTGPAQPPLPDAPPLGFGSLVPISELPYLIAPLTGQEPVALVQQGVTRRGYVDDLLALVPEGVESFNGRIGDVTLTFGDIVAAGGAAPLAPLYYAATAGQTVFPTTTPDHFGRSITLGSTNMLVYLNGALVPPDDGTGFGGYTLNLNASTITLLHPATAGEIVAISTAQGTQPPSQPQFMLLYYVATQGQTVFTTKTPDHFGHSGGLSFGAVGVYLNGALVPPDDGTGVGGYTLNAPANTITLLYPAGAGEVVSIAIPMGAAVPLPPQGFLTEPVTVTAPNTFAPLSHAATGAVGILYVNGSAFAAPDVTFSGTTLTWNNAIFGVATTDKCFAYYSY